MVFFFGSHFIKSEIFIIWRGSSIIFTFWIIYLQIFG